MKDKKYYIIICALVIVLGLLIGYFINDHKIEDDNTNSNANKETTTYSSDDLFTERDLSTDIDLSNATKYTVSNDTNITITNEGTYVISGTSNNTTIYVEVDDEAKVELVLDGVNITNTDYPCIYIKSGDKVFITTTSESNLSVTGSFKADDENNVNGVIYSKSDITLKGSAKLTINSSYNGIVSKDGIKITGGIYNITSVANGIRANDYIVISDGTLTINSGTDGLHAEYDEDDSVGYIYIESGTINIDAKDDGIHATTTVQIEKGTININASEGIEGTYIVINDGTINITSSDDGINAANKSSKYSVKIEINGGNLKIDMGQGDTDAIDSNGDLVINGGTITINAQSAFDYDGNGTKNGGTIIVNGSEVNNLTNQMMGNNGGMARRR